MAHVYFEAVGGSGKSGELSWNLWILSDHSFVWFVCVGRADNEYSSWVRLNFYVYPASMKNRRVIRWNVSYYCVSVAWYQIWTTLGNVPYCHYRPLFRTSSRLHFISCYLKKEITHAFTDAHVMDRKLEWKGHQGFDPCLGRAASSSARHLELATIHECPSSFFVQKCLAIPLARFCLFDPDMTSLAILD